MTGFKAQFYRELALTNAWHRSGSESRMILAIGNKVVYPRQGPCRIGHIVKRIIDGQPIKFYHLVILGVSGGELYVPVDKAQDIGVRLLLDRSEIPALLRQLQRTAGSPGSSR